LGWHCLKEGFAKHTADILEIQMDSSLSMCACLEAKLPRLINPNHDVRQTRT